MKKIINEGIMFAVLVLVVAAVLYYRPWQNNLLSAEILFQHAQEWSKEFSDIIPNLKTKPPTLVSRQIATLNQMIADTKRKQDALQVYSIFESEYLGAKIEALEKVKTYLGGEPLAADEFEQQRQFVLANGWNCKPGLFHDLLRWGAESRACQEYAARWKRWRAEIRTNAGPPIFTAEALKARLDRAVEQHFPELQGIRHQIGPAFCTILRGAFGTALFLLLWRSVFFFVLAPKVGQWPGLRPCATGAGKALAVLPAGFPLRSAGLVSAPSLSVALGTHEELYVRHPYLQSMPVSARVSSIFVFDWRMPISSLVAHLIDLTRIRPVTAPVSVVIAPSGPHSLGELALIEVPEGSTLVVKPRNLVGLIKPIHSGSRITREWKLNQWMAWLTLKLRFVVVHGPIKVILRGHRGVRMEPVDGGRAISREAVLGFSANLQVQPARAEPFWQYLTGNQGLFNDRYSGAAGYVVFEENAGLEGHRNAVSRNLGRIYDTVLTVFGV